MIEYIYWTTATGNSIRYWNNGSPVQYQNATVPDWDAVCQNTDASSICLDAYTQLWEVGTSETNLLIMGLVSETRTPSLDTSCKEGMVCCSSRPMRSLWSVYCTVYCTLWARPERQREAAPADLLKLRWIGTQRIQMTGFPSWVISLPKIEDFIAYSSGNIQ